MKKATVFAVLLLITLSAVVWAKSSYKNTFNSLYGTAGGNLDNCSLCHVDGQPYSVFNPYGEDVKAEFATLDDITAALQAVEEIDSDGDGDVNIVEILAGTLPGDARNSTPVEKMTWGEMKKRFE